MASYFSQVTIAGVGLLGGSMGLALKKYGLADRIIGISRPETIEKAKARGVVDEGFSYDELERGIEDSEVIFLTTPVSVILGLMEKLSGIVQSGVIVTDVGSTKTAIMNAAERYFDDGVFIGGHPMAGAEQAGVVKADADLYRDRPYILISSSGASDAKMDKLEYAVKCIGAKTYRLTADEHDMVTAAISHVPQLVSVALMNAIGKKDGGSGDFFRLAGGGLKDMTRIASSPFAIWEDICCTNTDNIRDAIRGLIAELHEIEGLIDRPELAEKIQFIRKIQKIPDR